MATPGRYSGVLGPLRLVCPSIKFHYYAIKDAILNEGISALFHPRKIHDAATAKMFSVTSPGFIAYENTTVLPTLLRSASGTILELGPGPGNQIHRYDPSTTTFIYGIEPNAHYRLDISTKLKKADLETKYKLLTCGIEDSNVLQKEGITEGSLDSVVCIQVLCAVEDPRKVMKDVWRLLRPGGRFVFWEHVSSKDGIVGGVQACWNPVWSSLVGCHLNRDLLKDILAAGEWEGVEGIEVEKGYSWLPRVSGVLTKKA